MHPGLQSVHLHSQQTHCYPAVACIGYKKVLRCILFILMQLVCPGWPSPGIGDCVSLGATWWHYHTSKLCRVKAAHQHSRRNSTGCWLSWTACVHWGTARSMTERSSPTSHALSHGCPQQSCRGPANISIWSYTSHIASSAAGMKGAVLLCVQCYHGWV